MSTYLAGAGQIHLALADRQARRHVAQLRADRQRMVRELLEQERAEREFTTPGFDVSAA